MLSSRPPIPGDSPSNIYLIPLLLLGELILCCLIIKFVRYTPIDWKATCKRSKDRSCTATTIIRSCAAKLGRSFIPVALFSSMAFYERSPAATVPTFGRHNSRRRLLRRDALCGRTQPFGRLRHQQARPAMGASPSQYLPAAALDLRFTAL